MGLLNKEPGLHQRIKNFITIIRGYTDSMESSLYINNRNVQVIDKQFKFLIFKMETQVTIYIFI